MLLRSFLRAVAITLAVLAVLAVTAAVLVPRIAAARLHGAARAHGMEASWRTLQLGWPARARLTGLTVIGGNGMMLTADRLDVRLHAAGLWLGRMQPASVQLSRADVRLPASVAAEDDTLAPESDAAQGIPVAPRVLERARAFVRALLVPARELPELHLRDIAVLRGEERFATISALDLTQDRDAATLAVLGSVRTEGELPASVLVRWRRDDQINARLQVTIADPASGAETPLVFAFDGALAQDRAARTVRVAEGSRVKLGELVAGFAAEIDADGPRLLASVAADGLTAGAIKHNIPAPALGPLSGLEVSGSFDWRASLDLDLARPDSVRLTAGVIPHGLALDPRLSRPSLQALAQPFTATIHLPHGRSATRDLSPANPHFRPLTRISPLLRDAVLTNEDGGFWLHRGFNNGAIALALAANLRAGTYRRGAGTVTMQVARNLWLGHQRTLARKAQEVVLTWLLEHASGLTKERLLEIYLNIIEWGPGVHGADEAARFYFDKGADEVTLPEALFLTVLVPSPSRWRWRVAPDGSLRPFARAQMHYIAQKMVTRGWLDASLAPAADSLAVTLRGPARALLAAPDSLAAAAAPPTPPADSTGAPPP